MLDVFLRQNLIMNRKTPKGKTPSLISGKNGRPKIVEVKKASTRTDCARCDSQFYAGTVCAEIPQMGKAYSHSIRVCKDCFTAILQQSKKDLEELVDALK